MLEHYKGLILRLNACLIQNTLTKLILFTNYSKFQKNMETYQVCEFFFKAY